MDFVQMDLPQFCSEWSLDMLGPFLNALIVQHKEWKSPTPEIRIYTRILTCTAYTVYKTLSPNDEP
jgi:hypothetical protein